MGASRSFRWLALGVVAGLLAGQAFAQLDDPPMGWDMWSPNQTKEQRWEPSNELSRWRLVRHNAFVKDGVPEPYQDARNPLGRTPANVDQGRELYVEHCTNCHDPIGTGRGDDGNALYPSPALLAELVRMPQGIDSYLMWAISEGGTPFSTQMPAFKDTLSEPEIWQIVTFMRAGFPAPN
ncbi:MAG: cytochrome c [Pseudomonadota bacterium]